MTQQAPQVIAAVVDRIVRSPQYKAVLQRQDAEAHELREHIRLLRGRLAKPDGLEEPQGELMALREACGPFERAFRTYIDWGDALLEEITTKSFLAHSHASAVSPPAKENGAEPQASQSASSVSSVTRDTPLTVSWVLARLEVTALFVLPFVVNAALASSGGRYEGFGSVVAASMWLLTVWIITYIAFGASVFVSQRRLDDPMLMLYAFSVGLIMTSIFHQTAVAREERLFRQLPGCLREESREAPNMTIKQLVETCHERLEGNDYLGF